MASLRSEKPQNGGKIKNWLTFKTKLQSQTAFRNYFFVSQTKTKTKNGGKLHQNIIPEFHHLFGISNSKKCKHEDLELNHK